MFILMPFKNDKPKDTENSPFEEFSVLAVKADLPMQGESCFERQACPYEGDEIMVKLIEIDRQGRMNLSGKDALPKPEEKTAE